MIYFVIFKNKKDKEYKMFSNTIFNNEKEAIDYAKRNKFKKSIEWKVVPYHYKYFKI